MLQPYLAMQLLSDPLLQGQGILGRCLMTWPASLAGQRSYEPVGLSKDTALKRYHTVFRPCFISLGRFPLTVSCGCHR